MLQIQKCESAESTACELFEQAIQLQHEGNLDGAVSLLHQAIEIYPCDHRFFVELSNVLAS